MNGYKNYGDVNYWEHGGTFVRQDDEETFNILYMRPICSEDMESLGIYEHERNIFFADCYVNINDDWIKRDRVMSFIDMTEEDFDPVLFAIGCVEYYGCCDFNDYWDFEKTKEEVEVLLEKYGIE